MTTQELGIFGENLAVSHLTSKGFTILDRNWKFRKQEIDIVASYKGQIVVVEVKARQTAEIGEPWMAVTKAKQRIIVQVADQYMCTIRSEPRLNTLKMRFRLVCEFRQKTERRKTASLKRQFKFFSWLQHFCDTLRNNSMELCG